MDKKKREAIARAKESMDVLAQCMADKDGGLMESIIGMSGVGVQRITDAVMSIMDVFESSRDALDSPMSVKPLKAMALAMHAFHRAGGRIVFIDPPEGSAK